MLVQVSRGNRIGLLPLLGGEQTELREMEETAKKR